MSDTDPIEIDPDILDLLPVFHRNRTADVKRAREHLHAAQFENLRRIGHAMAGSGASYGFAEISELGRALEAAAMRDDAEACSMLVDRVEALLATVDIVVEGDVVKLADWVATVP